MATKKKKSHTGFRNGDLFCFNCGGSYKMPLPQPLSMAGALMIQFSKDHKDCVKTWTTPVADPALSENERAIWWIQNGEHDTSSKVMFGKLVMTTDIEFNPAMNKFLVDCKSGNGAHPCDPDDFRRCYLLIKTVPEWKPRLLMLRHFSPVWDKLVDNWDKLTAMMDEQLAKPEDKRDGTEMYKLIETCGC